MTFKECRVTISKKVEMTGQNLRLKESPNTDLEIHLFEVFEPTKYRRICFM
jgi:hypothetical protein